MKNEKIAITAASGALGSAIIKQLKQDIGAENVIGIARTPEKAKSLGVEIQKGDYNSKTDFMSALKGINTLLLVSGMDHPDKRIGQHRNIIEAAKKCGVTKIVYTSIMGADKGNAFSPIVASNRQTEADVKASGLDWCNGRNGIYIEPDLEYVESYIAEGGIINCADTGKCGYTSRAELAVAYSQLLTNEALNGGTYHLFGTPITQQELAEAINKGFGTVLSYKSIPVEEYIKNRQEALGDFIGTVIGGIYQGIKEGAIDGVSDFEKVSGRTHASIDKMIADFLLTNKS